MKRRDKDRKVNTRIRSFALLQKTKCPTDGYDKQLLMESVRGISQSFIQTNLLLTKITTRSRLCVTSSVNILYFERQCDCLSSSVSGVADSWKRCYMVNGTSREVIALAPPYPYYRCYCYLSMHNQILIVSEPDMTPCNAILSFP